VGIARRTGLRPSGRISQSADRFASVVRAGRSEQSQIVTGLRGVGKTVRLNPFENQPEDEGYHTVVRELTQESSLPDRQRSR
jgi:Cdc6-like AAA superfamily ATPase